jgi:SAM-dependent methyltransferase
VAGVEPAARKVSLAQAARPARGHVEFVRGDALNPPLAGPWRAALLIDVLYLFDPHRQEQILRACAARLSPGGVLVLKEMDERPRWKAALNRLEEWLAVRVLRITLGGGAFTFRSLAEWAALCQGLGFETHVMRLDQGYYHPHGAVVGVRR